jgi:hypothetical protein
MWGMYNGIGDTCTSKYSGLHYGTKTYFEAEGKILSFQVTSEFMLGSNTWTDGYDHEGSSFAVNAELEESDEEPKLEI